MPALQHAIYHLKKTGFRPLLALLKTGADPDIANGAGWTAARFFEQYYGPFQHSYWGTGANIDTDQTYRTTETE